MPELITVSVAAGLPERQQVIELQLPEGSTAVEALTISGIAEAFPQIDLAACRLAVYGRLVAEDYRLQPGDRIELCRPLRADPREARRRLAQAGQSMGRKPSAQTR